MNLKDLRTTVSDMTDEELRAQLLGIRQSRRTSKKATTPRKEASKKDTAELLKLLGGLTPEEKEELLRNLQGDVS